MPRFIRTAAAIVFCLATVPHVRAQAPPDSSQAGAASRADSSQATSTAADSTQAAAPGPADSTHTGVAAAGAPADSMRAVAAGLADTLAAETQAGFRAGSFDAMAHRFAAVFLAQVPMAQMNSIPASYQSAFGSVERVVFVAERDDATGFGPGTLFFVAHTAGGKRAILRMKLDADARIVAWHLGPPSQQLASLDAVRERLAALPGRVSVAVRMAGEDKPRFAYRPDEMLAIGSTFKLYVLAELLRQVETTGSPALDSVVKLRPWSTSLPSGRLQAWPSGAPVTVQTLATLMISESDNTATDHLIELVGRPEIESRLGRVYRHTLPERNIPFLKTRELFLLQARSPELAALRARYLASNVADRRSVLLELQDRTIQGMPAVEPVGGLIDQLEWFASTRNLVDLMVLAYGSDLLHKDSVRQLWKDILAINPGVPNSDADPRIDSLGYKGGSEPGVINLTQWVETAGGQPFVISMTWNNPSGAVDERLWAELLVSVRRVALDAQEGEPAQGSR